MSAEEALGVSIAVVGMVGGMFSTGIIFYGLRTSRHAKAAEYLSQHPAKSFFIGFVAYLIPLLMIIGMISEKAKDGWFLVTAVTVLIYGIGIGVSGRSLAENMMPDATPMRQVCVGSLVLLASLLWLPLGFFVIGLSVSMGFGAWLRARKL